jgi:hypothetical protein
MERRNVFGVFFGIWQSKTINLGSFLSIPYVYILFWVWQTKSELKSDIIFEMQSMIGTAAAITRSKHF